MPDPDGPIPDESGSSDSVRPAHAAPTRQWPRLLHDLVRPKRGQLVVAIVVCLVAFSVVTQIRSLSTSDPYSSMRREDLLALLDQLNGNSRQLQTQIAVLESDKAKLESGADKAKAAQEQASQRLQQLQILAGTVPATGPGIVITISDPRGNVTAQMMLDAVEELRDAGAEAIQINSVRVVASTWFAAGNDGLVIGGQPVSTPYILTVIGEPQALEEGANFRGGLVSQAEATSVGASVKIDTPASVTITATTVVTTPEYAQPTQP